MPEFLQNGGVVELWAGWFTQLPASYHQRNEDGSWSAWGADWAVDVHIIEVGGVPNEEAATPERLLGAPVNASGEGWIGTMNVLREKDGTNDVFRLAAKLSAVNTLLSFWVSYLNEQQHEFASNLVQGVVHRAQNAT